MSVGLGRSCCIIRYLKRYIHVSLWIPARVLFCFVSVDINGIFRECGGDFSVVVSCKREGRMDEILQGDKPIPRNIVLLSDGTGNSAAKAHRTDGPLFLYVNDAVCGFCPGKFSAWPYFLEICKNQGNYFRLEPGDSLRAIFAESKDGRL